MSAQPRDINFQNIDYRTLSGPSLVAFFKICDLWRLSDHESRLLIGCCPSLTQFALWCSRPYEAELDPLTIKRISYLLSIFKALPRYLSTERFLTVAPNKGMSGWMRQASKEPLLNGQTPLDYVLTATSDDLHALLITITE